MMSRCKVLLIGAGPTNAFLTNMIKTCPKLSKEMELEVWEKENYIGGRFFTSTFRDIPAELGAQYLTMTKGSDLVEPYFKELLDNNIIQRMDLSKVSGFRHDDAKENYVPSEGMASIVEYFFKKHEQKVTFHKKLNSILFIQDDSGKIEVLCDNEPGTNTSFDIIVSTIPIPEFKNLNVLETKWNGDLKDVEYTRRYALALYFDSPIALKDGENYFNFIRKENNPICYWTLRVHDKKGASIVIHTNVEFGTQMQFEDITKIEKILYQKAFSEIKSIQDLVPIEVKCHEWKCSQVRTAYKDCPGFLRLPQTINHDHQVILAGDGFTGSGIEGCILSAQRTFNCIEQFMK